MIFKVARCTVAGILGDYYRLIKFSLHSYGFTAACLEDPLETTTPTVCFG